MKDFSFFDKALKLTGVKRLCSGIDAPWKYIPTYFLANVGGTELFNCNYDTKLLNLNEHIPSLYKQVICYWQEIKLNTPETKEAALHEMKCQEKKFVQRRRERKKIHAEGRSNCDFYLMYKICQ